MDTYLVDLNLNAGIKVIVLGSVFIGYLVRRFIRRRNGASLPYGAKDISTHWSVGLGYYAARRLWVFINVYLFSSPPLTAQC